MKSLIDIEFLFKEYYKKLYRFAYQVVNDKDLAEDVVQEVFISVWKNKDSLHITTSIEAYLIRATINKSISHLEKNKKNLKVEISDQNEFSPNIENEFSTFDFELFQKMVYASLEKLPPKCKAIFVLSRFENMKNKEIADHLEINLKTVENQISIAISKLNSELKPKLKNNFPEFFFTFLIFFLEFFGGKI